jgi:hypothetical protein
MRAAFLFSGQLRGFHLCVDNYVEKLFTSFSEYDTFFYIPGEDGKKLLDVWSPTSCILESDQNHPELSEFQNEIAYSDTKIISNGYSLKGRMQHYYLQWYGVKRVYELFQDFKSVCDIHYDVVFRVRTDFNFLTKLDYHHFDGLQIPSYNSWGGIYDRLAYGPESYLKYYCSLYDRLNAGAYNELKYLGNSESKLRQHLEYGNIPIKYVDLNYQRLNSDGSLQCSNP